MVLGTIVHATQLESRLGVIRAQTDGLLQQFNPLLRVTFHVQNLSLYCHCHRIVGIAIHS